MVGEQIIARIHISCSHVRHFRAERMPTAKSKLPALPALVRPEQSEHYICQSSSLCCIAKTSYIRCWNSNWFSTAVRSIDGRPALLLGLTMSSHITCQGGRLERMCQPARPWLHHLGRRFSRLGLEQVDTRDAGVWLVGYAQVGTCTSAASRGGDSYYIMNTGMTKVYVFVFGKGGEGRLLRPVRTSDWSALLY